jgi:hypothetical protein
LAERTAAAVSILHPILGIVLPILGLLTNPQALLLFGPIILLVVLACPPCAIFNFVGGIISSFLIDLVPVAAVAAAPVATLEAKATDTTSTDEPAVSDVSPAAAAAEGSSDASRAPNSKKPDELPAEAAVQDEQTSTETVTSAKDVTEPLKKDEVSASAPVKPKARLETPRPVVRDSLGTEKKTSDPSHRGNGGRAASEEPAGSRAATAVSSSAGSSSTDRSSEGGGSSEGDSADS